MLDTIFSIAFLVVVPTMVLVWFGAEGGARLYRIARTGSINTLTRPQSWRVPHYGGDTE
jgi:hypothetical protein